MRTVHLRGAFGLASLALGLAGVIPAHAAGSDADATGNGRGELHVPSPDWRDQVIYFAMIDRFDDGDPGNNDQGAGEFDPTDGAKFSGGDLTGLGRRLDYIRGLGATALWITPPVANQWWNPVSRYGGYHGYWARDFKAVDAHFGSLRDYQRLSRALHAAGMYLVQDVVVNHTANYFSLPPAATGASARRITDTADHDAPARAPFSFNDPGNRVHRGAAIYHWTPDIVDYTDRNQELNWQLAGLDDLNTENPLVRGALRDAYGYWIREAGVDGFRVDTAFYVPPEYFTDFLHADDARAPGIARAAAQSGRRDFHVFGEGFAIDRPYEDVMARKIDGYMRPGDALRVGQGAAGSAGAAGRAGPNARFLPGMINFPLYGTLGDVFARGHPTAELAYRIRSMMSVHERPHLMPTFVDNHDVDRFLAAGNEAGLKQALLAMLTLPGIPTIYYGTEQGFTAQRAAMFAGGHGAGGRNHFDAQAPMYLFLQRAIALRRDNRLFSRGTPTVLVDNGATSGALAYRMQHGDEAALVVFNSSDRVALLDNLDTGLAPGTALQALFAIEGTAPDAVVGQSGLLHLVLPPRSGYVLKGVPNSAEPRVVSGAEAAPSQDDRRAGRLSCVRRNGKKIPFLEGSGKQAATATPLACRAAPVTLAASSSARVSDDFTLHGTAGSARTLMLVVDGDLATATPIQLGNDGRWQARVDTRDMVDPAVAHHVVAWDPGDGVATLPHRFSVERDWALLADIEDPPGDDHGPQGRYEYPADPGWREHRQADLLGVRVWGSGGALKVQLRLYEVTALWNPAIGFDHVAFTLFLQLPARRDGASVMPQQNATLPAAMRWNRRLRAHGWSNALFDSAGASATSEGMGIAAAVPVAVDRGNATVIFTLPARALGNLRSLTGARLYINTWDYDGGYRGLVHQAQASNFGGGDGASDPLLMDETRVVVLP